MKIVWTILGLAILFVFLWVGFSIWSATCGGPDTGPDLPDKAEATHSFRWTSGGRVYSSDYEVKGLEVGKRKFILHGYWELRRDNFKFVSNDIILDEKTFGEIKVKRR